GDRHVDPAGMGGVGLLAGPGDVEPALGFVGEAFERVAVDRVDRHSLAGGDDADDAVARQRVAATGKMHRHSGNEAADRHRGTVGPRRARASGITLFLASAFLASAWCGKAALNTSRPVASPSPTAA